MCTSISSTTYILQIVPKTSQKRSVFVANIFSSVCEKAFREIHTEKWFVTFKKSISHDIQLSNNQTIFSPFLTTPTKPRRILDMIVVRCYQYIFSLSSYLQDAIFLSKNVYNMFFHVCESHNYMLHYHYTL